MRVVRAGALVVVAVLVFDLVVFATIRHQFPDAWVRLRGSVFGPGLGMREGFARYMFVFGGALIIDVAVLRGRSALASLLRFGRSERIDMFMFSLRRVGLGLTMPVLLSAGGLPLFAAFVSSHRHRYDGDASSSAMRVIFAVALLDFLRYWLHRLQHQIDVLWHFHALHHSATSFTLMTGVRVHPVDHLLDVFAGTVVIAIVGMSSATTGWFIVAKMAVDFAQHSMVPFTYGTIGRWLVYSPIAHRIHHSPLREHWNRNYGDLLPIWDRLFGTWYGGSTINKNVGLGDASDEGVAASILRPFGTASHSVLAALRSRRHRHANVRKAIS